MKITKTLLATIALTISAGMATADGNMADEMTIVSWGGAYSNSQQKAYHDPYSEKTGVKIINDSSSSEAVAKLRAMNEAGNVTWDVVDVVAADAIRLCDETGAPSVIGVSPLPKPTAFYGQVSADGRYTPGGVDLERTVVVNGAVYVGRPDVLMRDRTFQSEGALAYQMPFERSWDVDTPAEFAVCEALFPFQATYSG